MRRNVAWKRAVAFGAALAAAGWAPGARGEDPAGGGRKEAAEQECLDLREQVRTLTRLLEEARIEGKRLQAVDRSPGAAAATAGSARVVAVDPRGRWVAVDAGSGTGIRPGMELHVMRGDLWIARVRVEEARERLSGAVIEEVRKNDAPVPGDRVALARVP
jgi:hypothetical protein